MKVNFHTIYDNASGETWIADRSHRIARLTPPKLSDIVLHPEGSPLVTWLTLFWWQYSDNELPGRSAWIINDFSINEQDPECYRLSMHSHNAGNQVNSTTHIELTYDRRRNSYVYDVSTNLKILPGNEWKVTPQEGVEFANPWMKDAVGPAIQQINSSRARWNWVLYCNPDGKIIRLPLNHLGAAPLEDIQFQPENGWLGFFFHPDGNPIIELGEDTSQGTWAEVCAWGYDVHFIRKLQTSKEKASDSQRIAERTFVLKGGQEMNAHYRLFSVANDIGKHLFTQAKKFELFQREIKLLTRPAFIYPKNTFLEGISPSEPDNRWYWSPSHDEGVNWDQNYGRTDGCSLHIQNHVKREASWEVPIGKDFWMNPLPENSQRIRCWVLAKNVQGKGAYCTFRFSNYMIETGQQSKYDVLESESIKGSTNWVKLEILVPSPPPDATRAYLQLVLNGVGDAWFDDVFIEEIE